MNSFNKKLLALSLSLFIGTMTTTSSYDLANPNTKDGNIRLIADASKAFLTMGRNIFDLTQNEYAELNRTEFQNWRKTVLNAHNYIKNHSGNSNNLHKAASDCEAVSTELMRILSRFHSSPLSKKTKVSEYREQIDTLAGHKYKLTKELDRLNDLQKSLRTKFHDSGKIAAFQVLTALIRILDIVVDKAIIDFVGIQPQI